MSFRGGLFVAALCGTAAATWTPCYGKVVNTWQAAFPDVPDLWKSIGYCPEVRGQLDNCSYVYSATAAQCPNGCCMMMAVNGVPKGNSACCFTDGVYSSTALVGFASKLRPMEKPIYRAGRIVLNADGGATRDEGASGPDDPAAFINANEVHPGLIATQCPLDGWPTAESDTLGSLKAMLAQEEVSVIVQLDPSWNGTTPSPAPPNSALAQEAQSFNAALGFPASSTAADARRRLSDLYEYKCLNYAVAAFGNASAADSAGITKFTRKAHPAEKYEVYTYIYQGRAITHYWYYGWEDFEAPPPGSEATFRLLAGALAGAVRAKTRGMVECYSGRGRTGTMLAGAIAELSAAGASGAAGGGAGGGQLPKSLSPAEMASIVVNMRLSRDNMVRPAAPIDRIFSRTNTFFFLQVETPAQMQYLLGLYATQGEGGAETN